MKVYNIETNHVTDTDVLVMGTDGLWDVTNNEKTAEIIQNSLTNFPFGDQENSKYRY